jgi:oxygen-independent coproporphyrinogen-3 oxidase
MPTAGLYMHIPFCRAKCAYCDFVSYPGLETLHGPYVQAVCQEIALQASPWAGFLFTSIYIGGGTPTVLAPDQLITLLEKSRECLHFAPQAEITTEANPGTVSWGALRALRQGGVNRLSLGVQSLQDDELALLGRVHTAAEALEAYGLAREAGFSNINLDLIFGLPGQSLERWRETLERALALRPEHLSLYALSVEEGTPLAERIAAGRLPPPDDALAARMYTLAEALLAQKGYRHYEISNWARDEATGIVAGEFPRWACRHNLIYWRNEPYLGVGAAAYSYDGQRRWGNMPEVTEYIQGIWAGRGAVAQSETLDAEKRLDETMMLGLRLVRGILWEEIRQRFGRDARTVYAPQIAELTEAGLVIADGQGLRLTPRGRLLGNRAFAAFLR